jgi:hypothetical protein
VRQLKAAWIDSALSLDFVDAVELYSTVSYQNPSCSIESLGVPLPSSGFAPMHNPSCHITRSALQMFLDRSDAGWLLLLSDGSYVNTRILSSFADPAVPSSPFETAIVRGQCSEIRDYFQSFAKKSGVLVSRKAAQQLTETEVTWNVACEVEIDGSESLSHAMDINSLFALFNHDRRFLGLPNLNVKDYEALLNNDYAGVQGCSGEYKYERVCHNTVQPMNGLIVWGGEGKDWDRLRFLEHAREMIEGIPDNVHFLYHTYEAELCVT